MIETEAKIYLAGHRGMVGSAIVRHLEAQGYKNIIKKTSAELDLRRQADVEAFFEAEKPDYVFLAAARVGGIIANNTQPADFMYENMILEMNVIKAAFESGNYAWNSGMFIWRASTILKNFERFLPNIYTDLMKIGDAMGTEHEASVINAVYSSIQSISIDYGIMERSSDVVAIPAEFGWSDVGSWDMLEVLHSCNDNGNILLGEQNNIDTSDTTIFSSGRMVAAVGVANLVIVETPDAVLVCDKSRVQDVKKVVDTLNAKGRTDLL